MAKYLVEFTDEKTGNTSAVDMIIASEGYTKADYLEYCEKNAYSKWTEKLKAGSIELLPADNIKIKNRNFNKTIEAGQRWLLTHALDDMLAAEYVVLTNRYTDIANTTYNEGALFKVLAEAYAAGIATGLGIGDKNLFSREDGNE